MSTEVRPQRLHPVVPVIKFIRQLPELVLPMVGFAAMSERATLAGPLLAVGGLLAVALAYRVIAWWRFTYTLMPHEMYIESVKQVFVFDGFYHAG